MMALQQRPPLKEMLAHVLRKKTILGFSITEGSGWLLIHTVWSAAVALCFYGGNALTNNTQLLFSTAFYSCLQAMAIYPFWQLFFVRWRSKLPSSIIGYQFAAGVLYALLVTIVIELINVWTGHALLEGRSAATYFVGSLLVYFIHQLIFAAYHFWRQLQSCLAKQINLKLAVEQHELTALKAQIEPHFLFNTLNSISASVPASQESTRVLMAQLADTFRYGLRINENQWIAVEEEIRFLKAWLALEEYRFGHRLRVVYKINDECFQHQIPPMVLQPIIENALKHGLSSKREGGQVIIECSMKDEAIAVSISDNGAGYTGELDNIFRKGIGLSNICRRLQLLYNETLQVERGEEGLRFSFRVPVVQAASRKQSLAAC